LLTNSSGAANALDITTLVLEGNAISGLGNVTTIDGVAVNNSGQWLVLVSTDTGADVLLKNGIVYRFQGGTVAQPTGALIQSIGNIALNNLGQSAFNLTVVDTSNSGHVVLQGVWRDDLNVALQGTPPPSPPYSMDATYGIFVDVDLNSQGEVLFVCGVGDPNPPGGGHALMLYAAADTVLYRAGDILPGQTEALETLSNQGPHETEINDNSDTIFTANLTGNAATDGVIYFNSTLLAQEGIPSPVGANFTVVETGMDINNVGDWVARVHVAEPNPQDDLVIKNGVKYFQGGDPVPALGGETFTRFGWDYTPILIDDLGRVLFFALWPGPPDTNSGLFLSQILLMREGVTMVDTVLIDEFSQDRMGFDISDTGDWVIFEATLAGGVDGAFLLNTNSVVSGVVGDATPRADLVLRVAPNPFTTQAAVSYSLERPGAVDLRVYDVRGRLVAVLDRASRGAGEHRATWDGRNDAGRPAAAGVYFVRLRTEQGSFRAKIVKQR
jgi:hypothetical protein